MIDAGNDGVPSVSDGSSSHRFAPAKGRLLRPQFSLRLLLSLPLIVAVCFATAHYLERRRTDNQQRQMLLDALSQSELISPETRDVLTAIVRGVPSLDDPVLRDLGMTSYFVVDDNEKGRTVVLGGVADLAWDSGEVKVRDTSRRIAVFEHGYGVIVCLLDTSSIVLAVEHQFGPFCRATWRDEYVLVVETRRLGLRGAHEPSVIAEGYLITEDNIQSVRSGG